MGAQEQQSMTGEERVFVPPAAQLTPASQADVMEWVIPPIQRNLNVNKKLQALAETLKQNGGIVPGVITLGWFEDKYHILDGQHRVWAFKQSGIPIGHFAFAVRNCSSLAEMGDEFVKLNSQFNRLKTDDILRGLEPSHEAISLLRSRCPFVSFDPKRDRIRSNVHSPVVSVSVVLAHWLGARVSVPTPHHGTASQHFTTKEANLCADFLNLCYRAWESNESTRRLWTGLNLIITAWLYRRIVVQDAPGWQGKQIDGEEFVTWLMALSAKRDYSNWLVGRSVKDNRAECYTKAKKIIQDRRAEEGKPKLRLPNPDWLSGTGGRKHRKRAVDTAPVTTENAEG